MVLDRLQKSNTSITNYEEPTLIPQLWTAKTVSHENLVLFEIEYPKSQDDHIK